MQFLHHYTLPKSKPLGSFSITIPLRDFPSFSETLPPYHNISVRWKFVKFVGEYLLYFFYEIQKPCIPNWCRLQILKLNLTSNNYKKLSKPLGSFSITIPLRDFPSFSEILLFLQDSPSFSETLPPYHNITVRWKFVR